MPDWEALKEAMKDEGIDADGTREELAADPAFIKRVQRDAVDLTRELSRLRTRQTRLSAAA